MKKVITLATVLALTVSAIAEAKGGRVRSSSRSYSHSNALAVQKPSVTQRYGQNTQTQKPDATFSNTPNAQAKVSQQSASRSGSSLNNFATGALAGYVLSDMLSPSAAQAATPTAETAAAAPATAEVAAPVAEFKAFDAQNPALVGKAGDQSVFCLNGALVLMNAANQPAIIVGANNAPLACKTVQ